MISKPVPATQYDECKHGHLYTPENTGWRAWTNKDGRVTESRFCKECKALSNMAANGGYRSHQHERNLSKLDIVRENPKQCGKCLNGGWLEVDYDDEVFCVYCGWRPTAHLVGQLELGGN